METDLTTFKITTRFPAAKHIVARICDERGYSEVECDRCGMKAEFSPAVSGDEFEHGSAVFAGRHKDCPDPYGVLGQEGFD